MLKDFNISDYKIIKEIGQGSYGQILLVEDYHHQKYALKKIIGSSEKEIKSLKQEYQNSISQNYNIYEKTYNNGEQNKKNNTKKILLDGVCENSAKLFKDGLKEENFFVIDKNKKSIISLSE